MPRGFLYSSPAQRPSLNIAGNNNTVLGQNIFNITEAETKTMKYPDSIAGNFSVNRYP
jgi:hypothetical protein